MERSPECSGIKALVSKCLILGAFMILAGTSLALAQDTAQPAPLAEGAQPYGLQTSFPAVPDDGTLTISRAHMQAMTQNEHPLARMERIAHDYAYADSKLGYSDPRLLLRMRADGLAMVEAFTDSDGTAAMVVRDIKTGKYIVAFRGTDNATAENIENVSEVANHQSVGFGQYAQHINLWDEWAKKYSSGGKLAVTGHSRGGGLAALFTAAHASNVSDLVMFQSPGQMLVDHERFRKNLADWPKTTLVVAASDVVQLAGERHIGQPDVIVGLANDMSLSKFLGHTSYLLQNPWTTDWKDTGYRNPDDGLQLTSMDYNTYAKYRIGAAVNAATAKTEIDGWAELYPNFAPLGVGIAASDTAALLLNAKTAYYELKQLILDKNAPNGAAQSSATSANAADLFDHLLPAQFRAFEPDFYRIFQAMIEQDFKEIEAGTREKSRFFLDEGSRRFIRAHSLETLLSGLKFAYEGDFNSLQLVEGKETANALLAEVIFNTGMPIGNNGQISSMADFPDETKYALRIHLFEHYYIIQKQAFTELDAMFAAAQTLVISGVSAGATQLSEMVDDLEGYLLDSGEKARILDLAKSPPRPAGSNDAAHKQAVSLLRVAESQKVSPAGWPPVIRAYEEIHEDLFAGAISFGEYKAKIAEWETLEAAWWGAIFAYIPGADKKAMQAANAQRAAFGKERAAVDASFATQTDNKLAKLDLLFARYRDADIQTLLDQLNGEVAKAKAQITKISQDTPEWFSAEGSPMGRGEKYLASQAPSGADPVMTWLSQVGTLGAEAAQASGRLGQHLADVLNTAAPKADRAQDYILGVLDFYVAERTRQARIVAYKGYIGQGGYPDAAALRSRAYSEYIDPIADTLDTLLALQDGLSTLGQVSQGFLQLADDRSAEVAYFGRQYDALQDQEDALARDYQQIAGDLRTGSSGAQAPEAKAQVTPSLEFSGPILNFNGQLLCVPRYACGGGPTTDDYLNRIGARLRIWRSPNTDERSNSPDSKTALGVLLAQISEHQALAAALPASLEEVQEKLDLSQPLFARYTALTDWRKHLKAAYLRQINNEPLLAKALIGKLPGDFSISSAAAQAESGIQFDNRFLVDRRNYLQDNFIPKATKLIGDLTMEEARLRQDVNLHLQQARQYLGELKAAPQMPTLERAQKQQAAMDAINYVLAMNYEVSNYAPFAAEFAAQALAVSNAINALDQPAIATGRVFGSISDRASNAPLANQTVRMRPVNDKTLPPLITFTSDNSGRLDASGVPTGRWTLWISVPGYQTYSETISVFSNTPVEIHAKLARTSAATLGQLQIKLDRDPGLETAPVNIRVMDEAGNLVAQGIGPHRLAPGRYVVAAAAQGLQIEPGSTQVQIYAGDVLSVGFHLWKFDSDNDDNPPPVAAKPPSPVDFSQAVVALCAPDGEFVRSLFRTVLEYEPTDAVVGAYVDGLQAERGHRWNLVHAFLTGNLYQARQTSGPAFMTDVIQSVFGRQPTRPELQAWPQTDRAKFVIKMLRSAEHLSRTQACAQEWRKTPPKDAGETGAAEPESIVEPNPLTPAPAPPVSLAPGPQQYHTPAMDTSERSAIMDAARSPVSADIGQRVIFVVEILRSNGIWAYLQAVPYQSNGAPLDWLTTPYAHDWQVDGMSDVVMVLLHKSQNQWQAVAHVIGPTDVHWYEWVDKYGLPEGLFSPE